MHQDLLTNNSYSYATLNLLKKIVEELEQVSSFVSNSGQSWDYGTHIGKNSLQKINKLIEKIHRRLKGECLHETNKFSTLLAIANKLISVKDTIRKIGIDEIYNNSR